MQYVATFRAACSFQACPEPPAVGSCSEWIFLKPCGMIAFSRDCRNHFQDRKSPYQKEDNLGHFSLAQLSDRSTTLYAICCLIRKMENMKQALGVLLPPSACTDSREVGENPRGHLFVSRADQGPRIFIIQRGEINLVR